jgi:hypothetical protein
MNIRLDVQLEATDADLENLGVSLESIEKGCLKLKRQLIDELLDRAVVREQYLDRLIQFCHTGK